MKNVSFSNLDCGQDSGSKLSLSLSAYPGAEIDDDSGPLDGQIVLSIVPENALPANEYETLVDLSLPQAEAIYAALGALVAFLKHPQR